MARLAFLFTLTFLLFTFSHARFITSESQHDVTPEKSESEFDPESAILLPSEKPHFEPPKFLDFKHDDDASGVASVPLTRIRFNPVNRHFPRRPLNPFRHKHNCRFHKRFRLLNPRFHQKRFISYGNDMILSNERSFDPESRGVVRQIEASWGSFDDDGTESKHHVGFMKPDHHDHEHHDEDHDHEHHDEDHDHEHHDEDHDHEKSITTTTTTTIITTAIITMERKKGMRQRSTRAGSWRSSGSILFIFEYTLHVI
ncbi:hypothetical protein ES319_D08G139200v1 [Gossypium barbadense]|uniref:Uncharacterized protein n=1 Tax=Gossypium barbadense TaxID=3634 RepID=A0A5J5QF92_GOSBA|nr:hypothetical protein ES319_D08G139200v1 [Gossypium barbadense]